MNDEDEARLEAVSVKLAKLAEYASRLSAYARPPDPIQVSQAVYNRLRAMLPHAALPAPLNTLGVMSGIPVVIDPGMPKDALRIGNKIIRWPEDGGPVTVFDLDAVPPPPPGWPVPTPGE